MFDTERKELIFVFITTFLIGFIATAIVFIPAGLFIGLPFAATITGSIISGLSLSVFTLLFR